MQFHHHEKNRRFSLTFAATARGFFVPLSTLAAATLLFATACSDNNPTGSSPGQPRLSVANAVGPAIPPDYVVTPMGLYHRSCVHELPAGAIMDRLERVTRRDGTAYQIPQCAYPHFSSLPRGPFDQTPPQVANWIERTDYCLDGYCGTSNSYRTLAADWRVPANPTTAYNTSGKVYYTFPGLEDNPVTTIIQPVIQYGNSGYYGGAYWTMASWACGPGCSNATHSTPVSISAGDQIHGSIVASNCASGACTWAITTQDVTTGQQTVFPYAGGDNYTWGFGGVVETYGLDVCSNYPSAGVFFSQIALTNQNGQQTSPAWNNWVNPSFTGASCQFSVTSTTTTANLYHNPLPFTATISGKQYVTLHESEPYTETPLGGTAPFTYQWRIRQGPNQSNFGAWSSWSSTGGTNYTYVSVNGCNIGVTELEGLVTDATTRTADATYYIYVTNPC
jgi:hypothetical protein